MSKILEVSTGEIGEIIDIDYSESKRGEYVVKFADYETNGCYRIGKLDTRYRLV